jgi:hydroxyacylglutathione hydrolase
VVALMDGSVIHLGSLPVVPVLTPGHTRGGVCYAIGGNLFTGDTLFAEGCGICHGPGGAAEDMYRSVQLLKRRLQPDVQIFPGHSFGQAPGRPFGELLKRNVYLQIESREQFVRFRNRRPQPRALGFV